jgi:hypothetical protein
VDDAEGTTVEIGFTVVGVTAGGTITTAVGGVSTGAGGVTVSAGGGGTTTGACALGCIVGSASKPGGTSVYGTWGTEGTGTRTCRVLSYPTRESVWVLS